MKRAALIIFAAATLALAGSAVDAQSTSSTAPVLSPTLAPVASPAAIATPAATASPVRATATSTPSVIQKSATPKPAPTAT